MIDYLIFGVTFIGLLAGSITDIQRREVPDWISYGLMFSGIGLRAIYSIITGDWFFLLYGLIGFGILFGLAYLMFYTGQWGGGDSKILIGMGGLFATVPTFITEIFNPHFGKLPFLLAFWINLLIVGAIYAIIWSIVVAIIRAKDFKEKFIEKLSNKKSRIARYLIYGISGAMILIAILISNLMIKILLGVFGIFILISYFSWLFIKSVEESCMYKHITPEKLTEGDWVVKDIIVDGEFICGPKTLGVEKKHIEKLKKFYNEKKIHTILIKTGIPFIPSFFVAFVITCIWGNFILKMIGI